MPGGRRIVISGMGGELGSLVAALLEREPWVASVTGLDVDPPRRRLHHTEFHRIEPRARRRTVELITGIDPHVVIHVGVYEPHARATPASAIERTEAAATSVLGA